MIRQNSITIALDLARMSKSTEALSLSADLRACIASFVRTRSIIILVGAFRLMPLFWLRKQFRWSRRPPGLKGKFPFICLLLLKIAYDFLT